MTEVETVADPHPSRRMYTRERTPSESSIQGTSYPNRAYDNQSYEPAHHSNRDERQDRYRRDDRGRDRGREIRETIDCEMTAEIGSQEMTAGTDNVGMITERDATETAAETDLIEKAAMVDTTIRIIKGTSDMTNHQSIETQTRTISLRNQDIRSRDTMIAMMRSTILRDKIHSIDTMTGGTHQSIRNLPANQQRREEGYTFTEAGERKQETSHL